MKLILCSSLMLCGCAMSPQQGEALGNLGAAILSNGAPYGPSYAVPRAIYVRESVSGMNKLCYYSRAGSIEAHNLPSTYQCPISVP